MLLIFIVIVSTVVRYFTVQYEANGEVVLCHVLLDKYTNKIIFIGSVLKKYLQISLNVVDIYRPLVYKQNHSYSEMY
jgi:hypothetical protein